MPITSSSLITANILVADHPRDCLVHALTKNRSFVLILVLAMLISFLSFSVDNSPMHTRMSGTALGVPLNNREIPN
jgi:hypothetical protein